MAVNKVDVNGVTVLDLTQDSVTPATLKKGETAHDASGTAIVGEMESSAPSLQSKSVTYTENGTSTITPDEGYDGLSSVDVTVDVSGGSIGEIFRGEVIPTKETPPSELFVTLPNGEQMTITDLWSSHPSTIWNKIVLNGDTVSFSIINTTDSHVYTGTQIKQINIDFYKIQTNKTRRRWRRCLNGASYDSIADTLCFKTGSKYVYYWI